MIKPRAKVVAKRFVGTLLLSLLLFALCVRFGYIDATPNPSLMHFPGGEELVADYSSLVGSNVEVYGRVVSENPLLIQGNYSGERATFELKGVDRRVQKGEYLHVYATVRDDQTLTAIQTVVYPESGIRRTYLLSAVAGFWTVCRFINQWRFDVEAFAFTRRETTQVKSVLIKVGILGGDNA